MYLELRFEIIAPVVFISLRILMATTTVLLYVGN
jgi:hypothetical protein